jgi:hypothetical protein
VPLPWLPEGTIPLTTDTEVRSLWKINALCVQWCQSRGVTPKLKYFPEGVTPKPYDTEVPSLQKINACLAALS